MEQGGIKVNDLPIDVLRAIASHLDVSSLARLEQTCHGLNDFIRQHGWQAILNDAQRQLYQRRQERSARDIVRTDWAWRTRTFTVHQCGLMGECESGDDDNKRSASGEGTRHASLPSSSQQPLSPFSQLILLPHGLVLIVRCELRYWPKGELDKRRPLTHANAQVFRLDNPANLDAHWRPRNRRRDPQPTSALWDICASVQLDREGRLLALGRANGLVEIVSLETVRGSDELRIHLVWHWRDLMKGPGGHVLTACPKSGLLAVCCKHGEVYLLSVSKRRMRSTAGPRKPVAPSVDVKAIRNWNISSRVWSACFGGHSYKRTGRSDALRPHHPQSKDGKASWLAVGASKEQGILLYWLDPQTRLPSKPTLISCGQTSVYALAAHPVGKKESGGLDRQTLLAGCFDGTLRSFDVHDSPQTQQSFIVKPRSEMRDRFDQSAIYCICTGVGKGANEVAVGTGRHGVVKFFLHRSSLGSNEEAKQTDKEADGWSIFAAHPSHSPTYALAGQHDRLFGLTDQHFWQIDLRAPHARERQDQPGGRAAAFYRHSDMSLDYSRPPTSR